MKQLKPFAVLFFLIISSHAIAQQSSNTYLKIDYIKVEAEDFQDFQDLSENSWKAACKNLIGSGKLKGWRLYKVNYPGGTSRDYSMVSITMAPELKSFEDLYPDNNLTNLVPENPNTGDSEDLNRIAILVSSELWKVENRIEPEDTAASTEPGKYMTMDYMDVTPGRSSDYLMLEDEVARPIQEERIEEDKMHGWEVYSLLTPGGVEYGYNYATGNFFDNIEDIEFGFTDELIRQALPGTNIPELFNTIFTTRDLVRTEFWELVDYAN